jgi:group I intron endonuclease
MASGIYLITCTIGAKRYVGSSKNIDYRWRKHREKLVSGRHWNRYLQRSWNKYGSDAFEWAILEVVEDALLLHIREQHWIDTLHPEFNLSPFANRPTTQGFTYSEETLRKMSDSQQRVWSGLSAEERKARGAKTSHPNSPEHLARLRKVNAAHAVKRQAKRAVERIEWEAGREAREQARREKLRIANLGKVQSEETRAKLRAVAEQQQADPEYRAKHQQAIIEAMQRPEVIAKHREGLANRPPMSDEHKANIGKAHKGMKRPAGTGEKIAASKRGKHHSEETKAKLKAAWERRKARKNE